MLRDYRPVAGYDGHEFGNNPAPATCRCCRRGTRTWPSRSSTSRRHDRELHVRAAAPRTAGGPARTAARTAAPSGSARRRSCATRSGSRTSSTRCWSCAAAGGATRPDERQRGEQPAAQDVLGAVDVQPVPRLPPRERARRSSARRRRRSQFQAGEHTAGSCSAARARSRRTRRRTRARPAAGRGPDAGPDPGPPPCAYKLTEEQYNGARSRTAGRWAAPRGARLEGGSAGATRYFVPLAQPERGLIPLLLDAQAAEPILGRRGWTASAERRRSRGSAALAAR